MIELFSGIGAYSKALENLKIPHETVAAIEFDKKTMDCYNLIHRTTFEPQDITKLTGEELPDCDMICYSPPCQSFSVAGKNGGTSDVRGLLFWDALRIIQQKKPKYLLMENVKNLTGKKHRETFDEMLLALESAGYTNYWQVLNAKNYGVPQNRERVFVVSIRNDIKQCFEFPQPFDNGIRLKDLLESDVILPILHNIYGGFGEKKPREFWEYSPTIRTARGGGHIPSVFSRVLSDIRKLTPLECFRLQAFSDSDYYILHNNGISNSQIYKCAGNSIPVCVLEKIFKELLCPPVLLNRR